jgi:DHA3 family tetracycline resistance protein-like MFS transporter
MHHSYEGLDRSGGFSRVRVLAPLRNRNFRLLWSGMCVSLIGDGVFMVALAWQAYSLSNAPSALAIVGIAMTVPTIICLLVGGAASDRFDRRRVMLAADSVRAVALALLAVLATTHTLTLEGLVAMAAVYGAATAFFDPSFDAIVPEVLEGEALAQANSLDQLIRPVAFRLVGPAIGGPIIGLTGTGGAFAFDAVSFVLSGVALMVMAPTGGARSAAVAAPMHREIVAGMRYVRRHAWLWATFASAAIAYLLFMGPTEVLLPLIVKNELGGGAGELGLVFAAGGLGSLLCAVVIGQTGLPKRSVRFMYCAWAVATLAVAGYGLVHALWGLMLVSVAFNTLETAGTIAWATIKQRHVPGALLGRVSSLDWLISIGLLPVSFALTGPVSMALGTHTTLLGAGLLGGGITFAALFVPGVRALDAEVPGAHAEGHRPSPGVAGAWPAQPSADLAT